MYKVQRINRETGEVTKNMVGDKLFRLKRDAQEYADYLNYINTSDEYETIITVFDSDEDLEEEAVSEYVVVKINGDYR